MCLASTILSGWRQLSWPVLVEKNGLFFGALFFPVAFSFYFNNGCMMDNPVNRRYGHHGVWKDLIPLAKGLIRGND